MFELLAFGCTMFAQHHLAGGLPSGSTTRFMLEERWHDVVLHEEVVHGTLALEYPRYPQVAGRLVGGTDGLTLAISVRGERVELVLDGQAQSVGCVGDSLLFSSAGDSLILIDLGE